MFFAFCGHYHQIGFNDKYRDIYNYLKYDLQHIEDRLYESNSSAIFYIIIKHKISSS